MFLVLLITRGRCLSAVSSILSTSYLIKRNKVTVHSFVFVDIHGSDTHYMSRNIVRMSVDCVCLIVCREKACMKIFIALYVLCVCVCVYECVVIRPIYNVVHLILTQPPEHLTLIKRKIMTMSTWWSLYTIIIVYELKRSRVLNRFESRRLHCT